MHRIRDSVAAYLRTYSSDQRRSLHHDSLDGIDQIVVIPALAEKNDLFATLASLAENRKEDLVHSLALCVINNREPPLTDSVAIENNQQTLHILKDLTEGRLTESPIMDGIVKEDLRIIHDNGLRIAFIDASSKGFELPERGGGVGMARKIGMDAAVRTLWKESGDMKLILSLDADTLVEKNYLQAVRHFFEDKRSKAAVVCFTHRMPSDPDKCAAICCYEIFLRYYVLGLHYARSPYAFHTIGSTMVCTMEGYVSVRGMNIRDAAEDFYFMNKLAKIDTIREIVTTRVFPSARPSIRVPFGTGRRIVRFMEGRRNEYLLYAPEIFHILYLWLYEMNEDPGRNGYEIELRARKINPVISSFLRENRFAETWERIRENSRSTEQLKRQFMTWFDAFKTLKFIKYLSKEGFPPVGMFDAVQRLLFMVGKDCPVKIENGVVPPISVQKMFLDLLSLDA